MKLAALSGWAQHRADAREQYPQQKIWLQKVAAFDLKEVG